MEYEFGWNDPPTFSYSSSQAATGKQTSLTKRPPPTLSQPNDPSTPSLEPPSDTSCPPTATTTGSFAKEKTTVESGEAQDLCVYDEADFMDVIKGLDRLTDNFQDKLQKRIHSDIKRRLGILSQQTKDEKISAAVKLKTGRLLAAMEANDCDQADSIHVGLMVDHVSEVSQWLVGIKKLIATLKSN